MENEFTKSKSRKNPDGSLVRVDLPCFPNKSNVYDGETRTFYTGRWGQPRAYADTDRELIFTAHEGETIEQAIEYYKTISKSRFSNDKDFNFWSGQIKSFSEIVVEGRRCWKVYAVEPFTD